jgi:hypothetical protein
MSMAQVGNKQNSFLNGEWAKHTRRQGKKRTSGIRRILDKLIIRQELNRK